jgi:hypothetical protein
VRLDDRALTCRLPLLGTTVPTEQVADFVVEYERAGSWGVHVRTRDRRLVQL